MKGLLLHKLHLFNRNGLFLVILTLSLTLFTLCTSYQRSQNSFDWIPMFLMTFTLSFIAVTVRHQEKVCGWDQFSLTLPVSRKMVVQADYLFQLFMTFLGCFFTFLQAFILNVIDLVEMYYNTKEKFSSFIPDYEPILYTFVMLMVSQSAMYELNFFFGMDKSNSCFFIPLILAGIIYLFAPNLTILVFMATNYFPLFLINGFRILIAVLITYAFYRTALKRMERMEF
ncbi:MAG: ABC-2 transporter permease [Eubacteriales bacterium]